MVKRKRVKEEKESKEPVIPAEDQVVGVIEQMVGFDRAKVRCSDGVVRLCRIRGKMKKRIWMRIGDVVLVAPWDFQPERGDILHRYGMDELRYLAKHGYLKGLEDILPIEDLLRREEE